MTAKEKKQLDKKAEDTQRELIALLLKKAGLTEKDILIPALKRWAVNNLDLLTPKELDKYKSVLL